jgi:glycosyltransferase involved in cell wall biosynthesis
MVGHGIDLKKFKIIDSNFSLPLRILHLGRITKIKNIEILVQATKTLIDGGVKIRELSLIGAPVTKEDKTYKEYLYNLSKKLNLSEIVHWDESNSDEKTFDSSTISINAAPDGGMDKAVLATLAVNKPAFVSNQAFKDVYGEYWEAFSYPYKASDILAERIESFIKWPDAKKSKILNALSGKVRTEYSVEVLIKKLISELK